MSGAAGGRVVRPRMKFSQRPMPPKFAKGREWRDSDGVSLKWLLANGFRAKAEEVRRKWAVGKMVKGTRAQTMAGACESQAPHERRQHVDSGPVEQLEAVVSTAREQVEELEEAVGEPDDPPASAEVDPAVLGDHAFDTTFLPHSTPGVLVNQPVRMAWDGLNGRMRIPENEDSEHDLFDGHVIAVHGNEGSDAATCECWWGDHSITTVPVSLVRQCLVHRGSANANATAALCNAARQHVATCTFVWGHDQMPPCIRDPTDGKHGVAAFLLFGHKMVKRVFFTGPNTQPVLDHTSSCIVEFVKLDQCTGMFGTAMCSLCHAVPDRMHVLLAACTGTVHALPPCPHIVAVRHVHRQQQDGCTSCDHVVDAAIVDNAKRCSRQHEGDEMESDGSAGPQKQQGEPSSAFPFELPTRSDLYFKVLQVTAPVFRCTDAPTLTVQTHLRTDGTST